MSVEVNVFDGGIVHLPQGESHGSLYRFSGTIQPSQWCRFTIALESDNSPGVSLKVISESFEVDPDGVHSASIVVQNTGIGTASYRAALLVAPAIS